MRESLSLPIGTAPLGKGQQCLLPTQLLGTKQNIHSWRVVPGTSQTCAPATTMPFAESLTPTAQCANPQSQCPGWQPSTYFVTRQAALPTPAIAPLCPAGFPGVGAPSRSGHWSHSPFTDNDNDGPQEENEDGKATCTDAQNEPHLLRSLGHFEGSLALLARSWGEQRGQRTKGAKVTQARICVPRLQTGCTNTHAQRPSSASRHCSTVQPGLDLLTPPLNQHHLHILAQLP